MQFELNVETDAAQGIVRLKLKDEHGRHLASNEVRLADHQPVMLEGIFDTRRHVVRDARHLRPEGHTEPTTADELIDRLGVFVGQHVLGPKIVEPLLATRQHRTLLVRLPAATDVLAAAMARVPWEIARTGPTEPPLMSRGLVVRAVAEGTRPIEPDPGRDVVRVLLVFAEAPGSRPLAMRLERENLLRLFFDEILPDRRVEVDVLCHGVTRSRLVEQIKTRGGYEIVHWSGHGHHNLLELRGEDGQAEHLTGPDLVGLFTDEAGGFIPRLIFLSACLSGTLIDVKDWASFQAAMKGDEYSDPTKQAGDPDISDVLKDQPGYTGTALELLKSGVPQVVAMRYEVGDAYARDLAQLFYKRLLADTADHPADSALALARAELLQKNDASSYYAVDHATPLIFGEPGPIAARRRRSDQVRRLWPRPQPLLAGGRTELDVRPPAAFVGRSNEMTWLAESWLPRDRSAVAVVQGMAGMGKTSIASEAIALWHIRFKYTFAYQAKPTPLTLDEFCGDLHKRLTLASDLYREKCEGSPFDAIYLETSQIKGGARYEKMRANLIDALRAESILLVLDNYETNLEENPRDGGYASQHAEWDALLSDLARDLPPTGSRLLVTTRHWPRALSRGGVMRLPLGPLSLSEAALFLRGHDTLRRLHASGGTGEALVMRLMDVSRGHPLILERLSALAGKPSDLSQALDTLKDKGFKALPDLFQRVKSAEQQAKERDYLEDVAVDSVDLLLRRVSPAARRLLWVVTQANEPVSEGLLERVWSGKTLEDERLERLRSMLKHVEQLPESVRTKFQEMPPELRQRLQQESSGDARQASPVGPLLEELHSAGLLTLEQPDGSRRDASSMPAEVQAMAAMFLSQSGGGAIYEFHELVRERVVAWMEAHPDERGSRTPEQTWVAFGELYAAAFEQLIVGSREWAAEAGRRALSYLVRARYFDLLDSFASEFIVSTRDPELLRQVIAQLRAVADEVPPGRSRWLLRMNLGVALQRAGRPDLALDQIAKAAADAEAAEDWSGLDAIYGNWASALGDAGHLDASTTMYLRSAAIARKAGSPLTSPVSSELEALRNDVMQGHAERALPEIDRHLGDLRNWWRSYREGRPVPEAPDPEELGSVLAAGLDIARQANMYLWRWQTCLDRLDEIETINGERGEGEHVRARTRFNRYGPLLSLGRLDEAQRVLESCLDVFRDVNDLTLQTAALSALAQLWDERGDYRQAADLTRQALAVLNSLPDRAHRKISHLNLSRYLVKGGKSGDAARHWLAGAVYVVLMNDRQHLGTLLSDLTSNICRAAQSGEAPYVPPRLSDLLALPEFDALNRFLAQSKVDLDGLQTTIDGLVEQARQQALTPESVAREAATRLLGQLAQAASGQDIAPLLAALREQLLIANPGDVETIDALLGQLRGRLAASNPSGENAETNTGTELQTTIDGPVEQARQQALTPESLAREAAGHLLEQLAQVAASGQDVAPLLAALREQMLIAKPGEDATIDALLDQLRGELAASKPSGEDAETNTGTEKPPAIPEV
jgi:tetratricopeptide (TPR) repeat protein